MRLAGCPFCTFAQAFAKQTLKMQLVTRRRKTKEESYVSRNRLNDADLQGLPSLALVYALHQFMDQVSHRGSYIKAVQ